MFKVFEHVPSIQLSVKLSIACCLNLASGSLKWIPNFPLEAHLEKRAELIYPSMIHLLVLLPSSMMRIEQKINTPQITSQIFPHLNLNTRVDITPKKKNKIEHDLLHFLVR
ncbi:Uncharacterized protein TCM_037588 [Theobroma cacao]|uniref:Uncharacterized protein n=1 Tax=Theobroma cacao TaxID=3641 RepID=A0A061GMH0_THECC|nr:Uncharacterized protein TCM_037588 [Theobroma cacao]